MNVFLELQTTEPEELLKIIIGEQKTPDEVGLEIGGEVKAQFAGIDRLRSTDTTALVIFVMTFPIGIATNVVADLISDFLRRRRAHGQVNKVFITIEDTLETIDSDGRRTTRMTSKRQEISLS